MWTFTVAQCSIAIPISSPQPLPIMQQTGGPPVNKNLVSLTTLDLIITNSIYVSDKEDVEIRHYIFTGVSRKSNDQYHDVFIKLLPEGYGWKLHDLLAKHKLVPQLLWCGEVLKGRMMAVIKTLHHVHTPQHLDTSDINVVLTTIHRAMTTLHKREFIHSDLCLLNMLISKQGCAYLINFDWLGREGIAKYPRALNNQITWAAPVNELRRLCIMREHDKAMLELTLQQLRKPCLKTPVLSVEMEDNRLTKKLRLDTLFPSHSVPPSNSNSSSGKRAWWVSNLWHSWGLVPVYHLCYQRICHHHYCCIPCLVDSLHVLISRNYYFCIPI